MSLASFIGREREVAEVRRLLETTRLLTLTGAGGSGKTRLAIEAVRTIDPEARSWIELSGLSDPELLGQHVAEHLGLREVRRESAIEALAVRFRDKPHLLVLDNCEHVIDAAARLVDGLLVACPTLQVLATSREPLALAGERGWLVPALSLPPRDAASAPDTPTSDAIRLYVERARDVQPGFALDAGNAATIAEICRRLDGLPLAIELAAARARVLAPEQILARLHDSFRLLTSGSRTAIPRHQTLRATMDWSYALLTPDEQTLLDRLSVFGGGFTLEAAESTCTDAPLGPDLLDVLARLVDRSLVTMHEVDGSARYTLLETVRQYAADRLRSRDEEARLRRRHAEYVAALLVEAEPHWIQPTRPPWLARVHRELDNIRAALAWTREHAPELHLDMTGRLCWFWFATGAWSEARAWAEGALALPVGAAPSHARAATLFSAAVIACMQVNAAVARPWLEESVELARAHGDPRLEAYARNYLGMALVQLVDPASEPTTREALAWFRANHDLYGARLSLLLLGTRHIAAGEIELAVPLFEEAVALAREFGLQRELGIALQLLASSVLQLGDLDRATTLLHDSLVALQQDPQFYFLARSLDMIGILVARRRDPEDAVVLMGAADAVRQRIGAGAFLVDRQAVAPWIATLRTTLGDTAFDAAFATGRALPPGDAIARALAHAAAPASASVVVATVPAAVAATSAPADLVVCGLGPLEVTCGDMRLARDAWSSARARELLLFLLLHPAGRRREEIGLAFWPDATASQVKNSFHVLLHRLRKTLGRADLVIVDDERYRINPALDTWFDAAVFEREVKTARQDASRLERAIELYRGDLFDGEVTGEWHFARQDRLRTLFRDALSTLADLQLATDPAAATRTLERLVHEDPVREDGHRRLLLCYARGGQRDRALQQFEQLVDVLRTELDAVPSRTTTELADRIRRAEPV